LGEASHVSGRLVEASDLAAVLCYPHAEPGELQARILELSSIGVDTIELTGAKTIGRARVLGKGCVGIVVKALMRNNEVAVKIRRTDANRRNMDHEARTLLLANSVGVGPKLLAKSSNFLIMELVDGIPLKQWTLLLPNSGCKRRVRKMLRMLFDDCYSLDKIGLDHGELSEAPKNVLVDGKDRPWIVDFESASDNRRPSNVTSIAQYLLIGGGPAERLRSILEWRSKRSLISALRDYKQHLDEQRYRRIKNIVGLQTRLESGGLPTKS